MTAIVAGTRQAHARHSRTWGPLGLMLSMAPPVALIVAGIVVKGWGVVATVAFTLAATNFGPMTPVGILVSHLVWGAVLGLGYVAWPLG
jgi:hypothetical protein